MGTNGLAEAFDELNDEELVRILRCPIGTQDRGSLLFQLWKLRPLTAERITSELLRTTVDVGLAEHLARGYFGYGCVVGCMDSILPETYQRRRRAIAGGLGNPSSEIRSLCEEKLGELEERAPKQ